MSIKHESGGYISPNKDLFYYSSYFNTWSRVLVRAGRTQGFLKEISIPLTPYRGWMDEESVDTIKECIINVFEPCPSVYDKYTAIIPGHVYDAITAYLGVEMRNFLLDKDILRFTDLTKLLEIGQIKGGVPFKECSVNYPSKDSLIERLKHHPELYEMPYALEKHMENRKNTGT